MSQQLSRCHLLSQGNRIEDITVQLQMQSQIHLYKYLSSYITTCLPDGGDFIVLKLEVLLLWRNTLVTRLSSEESAFVLA